MKIKIILFLIIIILIPLAVLAKFCIFCGSKNPDEAVFCIQCGKKFPDSEPDKKSINKIPDLNISQSDFDRLLKRTEGIITFPYFSVIKSQNSFIVSNFIKPDEPYIQDIKSGDVISKINGNPISDLDIRSVDILLSKAPGEKINITFFRKNENKKIEGIFSAKEFEFPGITQGSSTKGISSYTVSGINNRSADEFRNILLNADKNNITELILDIRSCLSFDDPKPVIQMLDTLLPKDEKIGVIKYNDEKTDIIVSEKMPVSFIPLTLIVDETVEGAAEFFAASLSLNQRAILVGNNTAGRPFLIDWKKSDKNFNSYIKGVMIPSNEKMFLENGYVPAIKIPDNIPSHEWVNWYLKNIKK